MRQQRRRLTESLPGSCLAAPWVTIITHLLLTKREQRYASCPTIHDWSRQKANVKSGYHSGPIRAVRQTAWYTLLECTTFSKAAKTALLYTPRVARASSLHLWQRLLERSMCSKTSVNHSAWVLQKHQVSGTVDTGASDAVLTKTDNDTRSPAEVLVQSTYATFVMILSK